MVERARKSQLRQTNSGHLFCVGAAVAFVFVFVFVFVIVIVFLWFANYIMRPARTNQGEGAKRVSLCGGGGARSRTKGLSCKSSFVVTSLFFADIFSHSVYCFYNKHSPYQANHSKWSSLYWGRQITHRSCMNPWKMSFTSRRPAHT